MGLYIKKFDRHSQFLSYKNSSAFTAPNTSLCIDDNSLHYNPINGQGGGGEVHEYVDLGLPSGTLWATQNIGATNIKDSGLYFAWGETSGVSGSLYETIPVMSEMPVSKQFTENGVKPGRLLGAENEPLREYNMSTYKFNDGDGGFTKYNYNDGKQYLEPEDDAAYQLWGNEWKIPCHGQYLELLNYASFEYDSELDDYVFVSNFDSSKKLYIPNSNVIHDTDYDSGPNGSLRCFTTNTYGFSWSSDNACTYACFTGSWENSYGIYRYYAIPIRPVKIKNKNGETIGNWYGSVSPAEPEM